MTLGFEEAHNGSEVSLQGEDSKVSSSVFVLLMIPGTSESVGMVATVGSHQEGCCIQDVQSRARR